MPGKLFVFSTHDPDNAAQARGRFPGATGVTAIAADSVMGLQKELVAVLRRGMMFDRLLFQTHGFPGGIRFGETVSEELTPSSWYLHFAKRGYHRMFPTYTRVYFDGCDVGAGELGTMFLVEAGQVFTRQGGGEVFAFTNAGYALPDWVPFVGNHTAHYGSPLKRVSFLAGGIPVGFKAPHLYHSVIG